MRIRLPLFLFASLLIAGGAQAPSRSSVLPEIRRHLDLATERLSDGHWSAAQAHAELILITRPLRLWIDTDSMRHLGVVQGAAKLWERTLGGLEFEFVHAEEDADVSVHFQDHLDRGGSRLAGHVRWQRSVLHTGHGHFEWSIRAYIRLRTVQPNGRPMSDEAMLQASLHELGHVLGLADCEGRGQVMGPLDLSDPVIEPQPEELATLREIRTQALYSLIEAQQAANPLHAYNATRAAD